MSIKITGDYATICVLSLERPKQLKICLESIIANTDYPYELIVHDDGSTHPEVHQYLLKLLQEDKISTVIFGSPPGYNVGVGTPIQRMFSAAHGKYIIKLDNDTHVKKGWLSQSVKVFETFPEVVWLGLMRWEETDELTLIRKETRNNLTVELRWKAITTAFMIKRESLKKVGDFPEFSTSLSDDVTICGAIYPALCLCRSPERSPLELLEEGWLVTTTPKDDKIISSPGRSLVNVFDRVGNSYRRPFHFHPRVFGNFEKYPIEVARRGERPFSRLLSSQPLPPLDEIGVGNERDFRLNQNSSVRVNYPILKSVELVKE